MSKPNTKPLTERLQADRVQMAKQLIASAQELGATATWRSDRDHPRQINVSIEAPGGLCLNVDFNGNSSQIDIHILPWHIHHDSNAKLAPSFGQVNPHHHRKATHVAHGFEAMYEEICRGLRKAADGSAYMCQI